MKLVDKYGIIFFVAYTILNFVSTMVLYSWTAFGGRNSMNFFQKAIFFFFNFPSGYLKIESMVLGILINALFWSVVFLICRLLFKSLINKTTA